jgi:putative phosphoribosyl transferase
VSPVTPAETLGLLRRTADDLVVLETPDRFNAVGQAYADFTQISDEEVISTLQRTRSGLQSEKADLTRSAWRDGHPSGLSTG